MYISRRCEGFYIIRPPNIAVSSSHVRFFSALLTVYALTLSAFARWASVRLLSSSASRSLRARASSFFRFFSSAFCAFVGGAAIIVFDLLANGQLVTPSGLPPPELCENDECDGDEGVDGGHSIAIAVEVGVEKSVSVAGEVVVVALSSTFVTVSVGEWVSEG